MEAIKIDFTTNKQTFSEDHKSLVLEIDQVLKKDIDQLRNQIGQVEAKLTVKMEQDDLSFASGQHSKVPSGHSDLWQTDRWTDHRKVNFNIKVSIWSLG